MRFTFCKLLHMHQRQHLFNPRGDFRTRQFVLLQAERDILLYRHVREQCIRLEHHIDWALIWRNARQVNAVQQNLPVSRNFKTRQHTQQSRFPAPGGTEQRENFAFINSQADVINGMLAVKGFGQVADFQQRGERFAGFRLWAGNSIVQLLLSGKSMNTCAARLSH